MTGLGFRLVEFAGGTVVLGSDAESEREQPVHEAYLDPFGLADHCVTAGDYLAFLHDVAPHFDESLCDFIDPCFVLRRGDGYRLRPGCEDYPMIQISFWGAAAFCNWLSERDGYDRVYALDARTSDPDLGGYRLPTEAEWEHACRTGASHVTPPAPPRPAPSPPADPVVAGFASGAASPRPVSESAPDAAGLVGMLGNVREWCHDYYSAYTDEVVKNPRGPERGTFRVVRGGAFIDDPELHTPTRRQAAHEDTKCEVYGFRVARPL